MKLTVLLLSFTLYYPIYVYAAIGAILVAVLIIFTSDIPDPIHVSKDPVDIILCNARKDLKNAQDNPPNNLDEVTVLTTHLKKLEGIEKYRCATNTQKRHQQRLIKDYGKLLQEIEGMFDYIHT